MIFIYYRLRGVCILFKRINNGLKELRKISDEVALQFISVLKVSREWMLRKTKTTEWILNLWDFQRNRWLNWDYQWLQILSRRNPWSLGSCIGLKERRRFGRWLDYSRDWALLQQFLRYKSGLTLFSGPVSSGKTRWCMLCSEDVLKKTLQVIPMEDPVEYLASPILLLDNEGWNYVRITH